MRTRSLLQQAGVRLPPWMGSIRFRIALLTSASLFLVATLLVVSLYLGLSLTLKRGPVSEEVLYEPVTFDPFGLSSEEEPVVLADVRDLERRMNEHTLATMRNILRRAGRPLRRQPRNRLGRGGALFGLSTG